MKSVVTQMRNISTFSIVARDPKTGELGIAVQSKFLAVGAVVPWAKAGVGAIATRGSEGIQAGEVVQVWLHRSRQIIDNTIVCIGSHDLAIDVLADLLQRHYGIRLISSNVGSMGELCLCGARKPYGWYSPARPPDWHLQYQLS